MNAPARELPCTVDGWTVRFVLADGTTLDQHPHDPKQWRIAGMALPKGVLIDRTSDGLALTFTKAFEVIPVVERPRHHLTPVVEKNY